MKAVLATSGKLLSSCMTNPQKYLALTLHHSIIGFFYKNGPTPASFSFIFSLFKQTLQFLQQIYVKKCPSSIRCRDSNPRPLEHEFLPKTTRPGLPPYHSINVLLLGRSGCHSPSTKRAPWVESFERKCLLPLKPNR